MIRLMVALLMLAVMFPTGAARAQPVQYQFTPPPPIVSLPSSGPSYPAIPDVAPPVPSPGRSRIVPIAPSRSAEPPSLRSPRIVQVPGQRPVVVPPGLPGQDSYSDRVKNCIQAGAAAGLRADRLGTFTGQCAQ